MRKLTMIAVAAALVFAMAMPVVGLAVAAKPNIASALDTTGLNVALMPPVNHRTFWYGGAVMPVVVLVSMNGDPVTDAQVTIWVNGASGTGPGMSMDGNNFVNLGLGVYQYNLETKPYPAGPGSAPIMVKVLAEAGGMSATLEFSMLLH